MYNYGVAQGTTVHTGTYTLTEEDFDSTVDMGVDHSYRYISVPAKPSKITASEFQQCTNGQTILGNIGDIIIFIGNSTSLSFTNATQLYYKDFTSSGATIKMYAFKLTDTSCVLSFTMWTGPEMRIHISAS